MKNYPEVFMALDIRMALAQAKYQKAKESFRYMVSDQLARSALRTALRLQQSKGYFSPTLPPDPHSTWRNF